MSTIVRDIETRSTVDLPDVGAHIYATYPTTEVMTYGYRVDHGPPKIWHPDREPIPKEFLNGATWVAHNAQFEMAIERSILVPKFGFPVIPIERQVCTMAQLNALALPGGLDKAAKALNLEHLKDPAGARLMKQMAKPRKPKKGEDPNGIYWVDTPEKREQLDDYCIHDVLATYDIHYGLPALTEHEQLVWLFDQLVNERGFYLDRELAQACARIAADIKPRINDELTKITNGTITAFTQVPRITKWVQQHVESKALRKADIEALFARPSLPDHVRRVLELRLMGAQAAAAKVGALLQRRCDDGRVRGSFVYHAAGTGRWSSRGAQVHNLKRPQTKDLAQAIEVLGQGDVDIALKHYGNPLAVIGDCVRSMIVAAPGHTLIGGDFSGIEARVTAWLAHEESKLEVFRQYDAGTGPDPYIIAASLILDVDPQEIVQGLKDEDPKAIEQRHIGKGAELAFGFQGGVKAYRRFLPPGIGHNSDPETDAQELWNIRHGDGPSGDAARMLEEGEGMNLQFTDKQIEVIKNKWREAHPNIVKLWFSLKRAIEYTVDFKYTEDDPAIVRDRIKIWIADENGWKFMKIELPSGRRLSYPNPRFGRSMTIPKSKFVTFPTQYGTEGVVFRDNASGAWGDIRMYGGLATENIVQGIARDLLSEAMLRIEAAGYPIVAHVHDECVIEVPLKDAKRVKQIFTDLMMESPAWAEGLPIVAKSWVAKRYMK